MLGYSHVILVDCLETGQDAVGTIKTMRLDDLSNPNAGHSASAHDASLVTALEAARSMGGDVPSRVDLVTIEAKMTYEFSEDLSPAIAAAVPVAVQHVLALLE
jgi:hydrogenase maturation protease